MTPSYTSDLMCPCGYAPTSIDAQGMTFRCTYVEPCSIATPQDVVMPALLAFLLGLTLGFLLFSSRVRRRSA